MDELTERIVRAIRADTRVHKEVGERMKILDEPEIWGQVTAFDGATATITVRMPIDAQQVNIELVKS